MPIREAYIEGYSMGHHHTVEGAYWPEQAADDWIAEKLLTDNRAKQVAAVKSQLFVEIEKELPLICERQTDIETWSKRWALLKKRVAAENSEICAFIDNLPLGKLSEVGWHSTVTILEEIRKRLAVASQAM
jgi:hypothetical protein